MAIKNEQLDIANISKVFLLISEIPEKLNKEFFAGIISDFSMEEKEEIGLLAVSAAKRSLYALVGECEILKNNGSIGDSAGQYPQDIYEAFSSALADAKIVLYNEYSIDTNYTDSYNNLSTAKAIFETNAVDKEFSDLANLLFQTVLDCQTILSSSNVGDEEGEYPRVNYDTFVESIDTAMVEVNNIDKSIVSMTSALGTLTDEKNAFLISQIGADFVAIQNLFISEITTSQNLLNISMIGPEIGDYSSNIYNAFKLAIQDAQNILANEDRTIAMMQNASAVLASSRNDFTDNVNTFEGIQVGAYWYGPEPHPVDTGLIWIFSKIVNGEYIMSPEVIPNDLPGQDRYVYLNGVFSSDVIYSRQTIPTKLTSMYTVVEGAVLKDSYDEYAWFAATDTDLEAISNIMQEPLLWVPSKFTPVKVDGMTVENGGYFWEGTARFSNFLPTSSTTRNSVLNVVQAMSTEDSLSDNIVVSHDFIVKVSGSGYIKSTASSVTDFVDKLFLPLTGTANVYQADAVTPVTETIQNGHILRITDGNGVIKDYIIYVS